MAQLNWTHQSKNDLVSITECIAQDSNRFAKIQFNRISKRAEQAIAFPTSCRIVPEFNNKHIREFVLGNYRIIYRIHSEERIDILTIHHSARILEL